MLRAEPLFDRTDERARIGTRKGEIAVFVAKKAAGVAKPRILINADGEDVETTPVMARCPPSDA